MQYAVDTIGIEIARLQKVIRELKSKPVVGMSEEIMQARILEFENQIREMKKAIGVLKEYQKTQTMNRQQQYTSRLMDPNM